jgi:hypothetical protein
MSTSDMIVRPSAACCDPTAARVRLPFARGFFLPVPVPVAADFAVAVEVVDFVDLTVLIREIVVGSFAFLAEAVGL